MLPETRAFPPDRHRSLEGLFYLFLALLAAGLPLLIVATGFPPFRKTAASPLYIPYELFGFSAALAVLLLAWRDWARPRPAGLPAVLPMLLPVFVGLFYAGYIAEHTSKAFDYVCYESAVNHLLQSGNPYADPTYHFLYPPAFAQALALFYQATYSLPIGAQIMGGLPFYLYQCAQFFMVLIVLRLLAAAGRAIGFAPVSALLLAAALLIFNNPLIRTLHHNQVNLFVLAAMLGGLLLAERRPLASGLLLALAIHIKVYPLILLLALALARRWRALAAAAAAAGLIVIAGAVLPGGLKTYSYYLDSLRAIPDFHVFRDNSIRNAVHCALGIWHAPAPDGALPRSPLESPLALALQAAVFAWIALRLWRRQRLGCGKWQVASDMSRHMPLATCHSLLWAHAADLLALALLISPLTWEHHYLFALPLILWSIALNAERRPAALVLAVALCIAVPTFDLFPFSFQRLAGLLLLLALTPPGALPRFAGWPALEASDEAREKRDPDSGR